MEIAERMNLTRVKALTKKEFIQVARDYRSLALAIAIPVLLLILFGFALSLDVDNVPLAIWDQDKTQNSADFIRKFQGSRYFKVVGYFGNYEQLEEMINKNQVLAAMVISTDFSKRIQSSQTAAVQLLVDGSDSNTATIALGYASSVVSNYNTKFVLETFSKFNMSEPGVIDVRPRIWFNQDLKSRNYIVPGLIAVIIMIIAALLTSLTVARERERGTMEQLISTPVKASEIILGKFIPYFIIGLVDQLIAVAMAQFVYHVPFRGSFVLLFLCSSLFLAGSLALGMLVSIRAKNQLMASQLAMLLTFLPGFLLSGFAWAISNMPPAIRAITHVVPARYFITILRGIYLKGIGIKVLLPDITLLAVFTIIMIFLAGRSFKKKVFY
jgi:ABC-2 type transport system permease protein